jgi:beta-galactosidase
VSAGEKDTEADLKALKKEKINTLYVDYPQPYWFYDICDRVGIYVVERANINTDPKGGDRSRRGSLVNNLQWLEEFIERQAASYYRSRIHPASLLGVWAATRVAATICINAMSGSRSARPKEP